MTGLQIFGLILLPVAFLLTLGMNKQHRETTGVNGPTQRKLNNIRKNARKNGTTVEAEYQKWLVRQQRKARKAG